MYKLLFDGEHINMQLHKLTANSQILGQTGFWSGQKLLLSRQYVHMSQAIRKPTIIVTEYSFTT